MLETEGDEGASGPLSRGARAANDASTRRVIPLLRSFTMFNAAQVDGLPESLVALPEPAPGWSPVAEAQELLAQSGAVIRHGGEQDFTATQLEKRKPCYFINSRVSLYSWWDVRGSNPRQMD